MKCELKAFFVVLIVQSLNCAPYFKNNKEEVLRYLESYGYYKPSDKAGSKISHKELKHSLKQLQAYGHIQITGEIDESTLALIKKPRCGVPDITVQKRRRRYDLLSTKWEKHDLTWHLDNTNGYFYHESLKVRRLIAEAVRVWSKSSVLTFKEVHDPGSADIVISFEAAFHPHIDDYDMRTRNALAHGFSPAPGLGGDIHVNKDVDWDFDVMFDEVPNGGALSFFSVILHEIGHTIGLHHSHDPNAVMYASYTGATALSMDDIEGIQYIYGVPRGQHDTETTTRSPSITISDEDVEHLKIPDKCDTSYDAMAWIRNELFIFKGIYMWRPNSNSDAIEIRRLWTLPEYVTHVDSVYENDDGLIMFFYGREIFAFHGTTLAYKSSLSHLGIDHYFEKIDAVFTWHFNLRSRTYIFSGDQYWRLDGDFVDRNYPKDVSKSWHDVYDIDTAFSDDDGVYFVKGTSYYVFNPRTMRIDRMNPLSLSEKFMRCQERRRLKLEDRFGDDIGDGNDDVIDMGHVGQKAEDDEDEDNIEKQDDLIEIAINETSSNHVSGHCLLFPIFLASRFSLLSLFI